jgi:hypothetical protein
VGPLGVFKSLSGPFAKGAEFSPAFIEAQLSRTEITLELGSQRAQALEHFRMEARGGQVITQITPGQPLRQEGKQTERHIPAAIEHGHVVVASDGDATLEVCEQGRAHRSFQRGEE